MNLRKILIAFVIGAVAVLGKSAPARAYDPPIGCFACDGQTSLCAKTVAGVIGNKGCIDNPYCELSGAGCTVTMRDMPVSLGGTLLASAPAQRATVETASDELAQLLRSEIGYIRDCQGYIAQRALSETEASRVRATNAHLTL